MKRRLISLTCVEDNPRASCCIKADGQTIGRPPFSQSCGCVKRNSQSIAWTRRGDMPSRGAAALNAASSCPGVVTPTGRPVKPSALRSTLRSPGVSRRNPVGPETNLLRGASSAWLSISIAPPFSPRVATGTLHRSRKRQFPLTNEACIGYRGGARRPDVGRWPVTSSQKARPARRAFTLLGHGSLRSLQFHAPHLLAAHGIGVPPITSRTEWQLNLAKSSLAPMPERKHRFRAAVSTKGRLTAHWGAARIGQSGDPRERAVSAERDAHCRPGGRTR